MAASVRCFASSRAGALAAAAVASALPTLGTIRRRTVVIACSRAASMRERPTRRLGRAGPGDLAGRLDTRRQRLARGLDARRQHLGGLLCPVAQRAETGLDLILGSGLM